MGGSVGVLGGAGVIGALGVLGVLGVLGSRKGGVIGAGPVMSPGVTGCGLKAGSLQYGQTQAVDASAFWAYQWTTACIMHFLWNMRRP